MVTFQYKYIQVGYLLAFRIALLLAILSSCHIEKTKKVVTSNPPTEKVVQKDSNFITLTLYRDSFLLNNKSFLIRKVDGFVDNILSSEVNGSKIFIILKEEYDSACYRRILNYLNKSNIEVFFRAKE